MIGSRIALRLNQVGMSQAELARRVKLDQSTINALVRGGSKSSRHLHKIARELTTTPAYLSAETDDPSVDAVELALSYEDREWLDLIHRLEAADRKVILKIIRSLAGGIGSSTVHSSQAQFQR